MTPGQNWKGWTHADDLPNDVRASIQQGAISPLLSPEESARFRGVVLSVFGEALDLFLEAEQLRWRCDHVRSRHPHLPMEAVFRAVSLEIGVSVPRLRTIWYVSRRKSRVAELVKEAVGGPMS